MNKITTYLGAFQRPMMYILIYLLINPHALDAFMSVPAQQYFMKVWAAVVGFVGWYKDYKTADAKTVSDLIQAVPITDNDPKKPLIEMKAVAKAAALFVVLFLCVGCASFRPNTIKIGVGGNIQTQDANADIELDFPMPK